MDVWYIIIPALVIIVTLIMMMVLQAKLYSIKVIVWKKTNNRYLRIDDKARKVVDPTNGMTYYKLWKLREVKYGEAPPEAIELTPRGVECLEMVRLGVNQFAWRTNQIKDIKIKKRTHVYNDETHEYEDQEVFENYTPLLDEEKSHLVEQIAQAEEIKNQRRKDWKENLPQIMFGAMVLMFVIFVFIFWGDIMKTIDARDVQVNENIRVMTEYMREYRQLEASMRGIQYLEGDNSTDGGLS